MGLEWRTSSSSPSWMPGEPTKRSEGCPVHPEIDARQQAVTISRHLAYDGEPNGRAKLAH